mgnify:CR=1 FL=1
MPDSNRVVVAFRQGVGHFKIQSLYKGAHRREEYFFVNISSPQRAKNVKLPIISHFELHDEIIYVVAMGTAK